MATLEPSIALTSCEVALRELMGYCYQASYGAQWLQRVSSPEARRMWEERASVEAALRQTRGVAEVPNAGLAYANFSDLVRIADKWWEPLAAALGKRKDVIALLERLDDLRNTVAHSRHLLVFEQDLMSGIAGQIRNQVTLYMTTQDDAGDFYPRIESIMDSLGRRIESSVVNGEIAGVRTDSVTVRPGDVIAFSCIGVDPQERDLYWELETPAHGAGGNTVARSGQEGRLVWRVSDADVREVANVEIYMRAEGSKYRRFGHFDHRAYFSFRVRPPR